MPLRLYTLLANLINSILMIVGAFLGLRFILELVSANPSTPFVAWIYSISEMFIYPFRGIVPNVSAGIGILDIVAIIALVAYSILGYILISLLRSVTSDYSDRYGTAHYHDLDEGDEDREVVVRRRHRKV